MVILHRAYRGLQNIFDYIVRLLMEVNMIQFVVLFLVFHKIGNGRVLSANKNQNRTKKDNPLFHQLDFRQIFDDTP